MEGATVQDTRRTIVLCAECEDLPEGSGEGYVDVMEWQYRIFERLRENYDPAVIVFNDLDVPPVTVICDGDIVPTLSIIAAKAGDDGWVAVVTPEGFIGVLCPRCGQDVWMVLRRGAVQVSMEVQYGT